MLTKLEYLKKCVQSIKPIENKSWYITCFSIPILKDDNDWQHKNLLEIVTKQDGLYFIDINAENIKELVKISDYKKDTPLFTFQELIDIDASWLPYIKSKIITKIGVLIVNALILYPAFKGKLEYINETIQIPKIEKLLAIRVVNDDQAKPNDLTISEMIDCFERFTFLSNLSNIINVASTAKLMTPPANIDKLKKDLLKEYEGQLSDPVKLVELENKLQQIDNDYLKDDPDAVKLSNSKMKVARRKMYLIYGDTMDFEKSTKARTVQNSLLEGLDTSEEEFPKYMNDLRLGSYSRGASTQLGGYTYKILQRSLSNLSISATECNTKRGLKRLIDDSNASKLLNRYILEGSKWILVESIEQTKKYIGKEIVMRSSIYCTSPKNTVCYKCMSEVYKNSPTGVTNIASELSGVLLGMFMALMHTTQTESATIQLEDLAA